MNFIKRLFGKTSQGTIEKQSIKPEEQALIIRIRLSDDEFGQDEERMECYDLEDEIEERIEGKENIEIDGHEFGGGFFTVYIYGDDTDRMFEMIKEIFEQKQMSPGSYLTKRYGGVDSKEIKIELS